MQPYLLAAALTTCCCIRSPPPHTHTLPLNVSQTQAGSPPLTVESVTAALEEVRPYLLADGGDVVVLDVNVGSGVVMVEMQGACSSCASSRWVCGVSRGWGRGWVGGRRGRTPVCVWGG